MTTLEELERLFAAGGWPARPHGPSALRLRFAGDNGEWPCVAHLRAAEDQLVFYSLFPEPVPAERRADVMELITRSNVELVNGCFDLDLDDGELRYRTCLDPIGRLTAAALTRPVGLNVATMDRFLPAITALVRGEVTVAEAFARAWQPAR